MSLTVEVARPQIDRETVHFQWKQSAPNPFQRTDAFFFRYEDLDLTIYSPLLFYEVFLALQLRVFAAYEEPVDVVLPEPLPRSTVEFWRAVHSAERVTVGPISERASYEPRRANSPDAAASRRYAVFFGGGKDSTLSAELLTEMYGGEHIVLIQFVGPLNPSKELDRRLTARQENVMLRPARERLGVATQRVWTDYQAHFLPAGARTRPHVELYTAGALPVLLNYGVELATFCYAWTEYPVTRQADGRPRFRFASSRPESLADQSRHYQRVLGANVTLTNLGLPFGGVAAYRMLAERYPNAARQIVPCTLAGVDERWCYDCKKCGNLALIGLAGGLIDPTFDYGRYFATSRHIQGLVAYAESGVDRSCYGNAPWFPKFSAPIGYQQWCHAIATLPVESIADRLGPDARTNLSIVQALFGNRTYPGMEVVPAKTIDLLDNETARQISRIAAEHLELAEDLPKPHLVGNAEVEFDFGLRTTPRTAGLDHLREDLTGTSEAER